MSEGSVVVIVNGDPASSPSLGVALLTAFAIVVVLSCAAAVATWLSLAVVDWLDSRKARR